MKRAIVRAAPLLHYENFEIEMMIWRGVHVQNGKKSKL